MPIGVMYGLVTGMSEQITPAGFGVLDDALLGNLLDDAHALLPQRVAENAEHLGAAARLAAAHAAFVHAHVGEARGGVGIRAGPADRLAEAIDLGLVVAAIASMARRALASSRWALLRFSWGDRIVWP